MSEPDDTAPYEAMPLLDVPVPEPEAPLPLAAPAAGAPYRASAPVIEEPELEGPPPSGRRPRPILGPAISVFAVLLWAFVVAGQYTTSWTLGAPLAQSAALIFVFVATGAAWLAGWRNSRSAAPPRSALGMVGRGLALASLAFVLFLICIIGATAAGGISSRNHDLVIPFTLVVIAILAAIAGPRVTSPLPTPRTQPQVVILVTLWIFGALLTLVAGADLAANS